MFDTIGAFKKQFTRVDGGYVFYPSRRAGGKAITAEEYDRLISQWERVAGRAGRWKAVGVAAAAIVLWTFVSQALSLPAWANSLLIAAIVVALSAWLLWASTAPRRLVRGRAPVTPPRPPAEARRAARAALNWSFILFVLLFSGGTFISTIQETQRSPETWAWLVGSGLMFSAYVWIGFRKLVDRKS